VERRGSLAEGAPTPAAALDATTDKVIGIGASTGGVAALGRILPPHGPAGALSAPGAGYHARRLPVIPAMAPRCTTSTCTAWSRRRRPVWRARTLRIKTLDEMCLHYIWLRFPYAEFAAAIR